MNMSMTVAELIALLQQQPQDLLVAYRMCSEKCLLRQADIFIEDCCEPRPDGWVQDARPDMPTRQYLVLPGR
jgi:hypothetical protein